MKINLRSIILMSSISTFLLMSYALSILKPAEGYEISIYSSTPSIFWIAIILGLLNGIFILALYENIGKMWIIGLFDIIFFNVLPIFLYALRGYVIYLGRGDAANYVGMALDIYKYGTFLDNFYPITSIFVSQIGLITNISIYDISKYLSSLFYIVFILFIYCWSKSINDNKRFITACMIASSPILFPWFSTSIYHMLLSVLTVPILFYTIQKSSDIRFRFLSTILVLIFPFFHPIIAIMIFIYLSSKYVYDVYINKKKTESIFLILIAFVSILGWFISQYVVMHDMGRIILQIYRSFETMDTSNQATTATQAVYYVHKLGLAEILRSTLFMTAHEIIFYILSLVTIFYMVTNKDKNIISMGICFIVGSLFMIFIFFTSKSHTPDRLINLNPNMIFAPLLTGFLIFKTSHRYKSILLTGLIIFSSITSIFSIYQSPIIIRPNDQTTNNDVKSMEWLLTQRNPNITTINIMEPLTRYANFIYGNNFAKKENLYSDIKLPDHFNFTNGLFLIEKDSYLVITNYDIQAYTTVWKKVDRFNNDDFIAIDLSKNINKIYDSKEVYFYYIMKLNKNK